MIPKGQYSHDVSLMKKLLLKMFCTSKDGILSRKDALIKIWGADNYFTTRSMDVFIARLRKYLKIDPSVGIINIHGNGFRLVISNRS